MSRIPGLFSGVMPSYVGPIPGNSGLSGIAVPKSLSMFSWNDDALAPRALWLVNPANADPLKVEVDALLKRFAGC